MNEKEKLEAIAQSSNYHNNIGTITIRYCADIFMRYMSKGNILELGPAEGVMTDILYKRYNIDYTVVDGSTKFIQDIKARYPEIQAYDLLFEEFIPTRSYDNIILGHVLEHVTDPIDLLRRCKQWLSEGGRILTAVPNKNSIHRQAAVHMGLLKKLDDFSEKDKQHGHRRVFSKDSLKDCFIKAGLKIQTLGGYWLKPLSDGQIEQSWTTEMIQAFLNLGEKYPEIAGEIYVIACKGDPVYV